MTEQSSNPGVVRANIYCPGPSLCNADPREADVELGVNRAPAILARRGLEVDWWIFMDHAVAEDPENDPPHRPAIFTTKTCERHLAKRGLAGVFDNRRVVHSDGTDQIDTSLGWRIFSTPMAVIHAYRLGATDILMYGVDMTDEPDADGKTPEGARRDAERWQREREIMGLVRGYLSNRGVSLGSA